LIDRALPETALKIRACTLEGPKKFFFKPPHDGYQKTQNFMLISKMQTYLSDKMHLKRVMSQQRLPKLDAAVLKI
jgi:hypothetical protein